MNNLVVEFVVQVTQEQQDEFLQELKELIARTQDTDADDVEFDNLEYI